MPAYEVLAQPKELRGVHYNWTEPDDYTWFEFEQGGEVYAVAGMCMSGGNVWSYWRIVRPSVQAWRDLRREVVPWLKEYAREHGADTAYVSTDDPADVDFEKMVGFMGFETLRLGVMSLEV